MGSQRSDTKFSILCLGHSGAQHSAIVIASFRPTLCNLASYIRQFAIFYLSLLMFNQQNKKL